MKLSDFVQAVPIDKGWSGDRKYCVTDHQGQRLLLRLSPAEQYERKKAEFDYMQQLVPLQIPMCMPVAFGVCDEGVYSLQSWIEGEDAQTILPSLPPEQAYRYGLDAGRILRKIHSLPAPDTAEDWALRFNRKIDRKIAMYAECPLQYENGEAFLEHIKAHRHLLNGRPQCCQHGDYHTGNMMIDRQGWLTIIDFNRADHGDPWEEFNRIVWCVQCSPAFASGMVDGYFDGAVPMDFWNLLALYISSNTLSSLPWAIPFGQQEIDVMRKQAADVLDWYSNMTQPVPKWYQPRG